MKSERLAHSCLKEDYTSNGNQDAFLAATQADKKNSKIARNVVDTLVKLTV
jgi:hypothetical protein